MPPSPPPPPPLPSASSPELPSLLPAAAAATEEVLAPHVRLYQDVRRRLHQDNQVTFEESGRAFLTAMSRQPNKDDADTLLFIEDTLPGAVDIFLAQSPAVVASNLLFHFEDVLKSAARMISRELRVDGNAQRVDVLGRILDESAVFYQDRKALLPGGRRLMTIRNAVAKELVQDGTFSLLLNLLQQQQQQPSSTSRGRLVSSVLLCVNNAKVAEVDKQAFVDAALHELRRYVSDAAFLRKQKAEDLADIHVQLILAAATASGGAPPAAPFMEDYYPLSLLLWLRCLEADNFALKRFGLDNLLRAASDAARNRPVQRQPVAAVTPPPSAPTTPNPRWDDSALCRWLVDSRVLETLFGSQQATHSALVGRSRNLLKFMAVAGALGQAEVDYLFTKVGERRQHEADSGALQALLAELVLDLCGLECATLILKRAVTRCDDMYAFARKLVEHVNRNRQAFSHALQVHILELLWGLLSSDTLGVVAAGGEETEERRRIILGDFTDALRNAIVPVNAFAASTSGGGSVVNKYDAVFNDYLAKCTGILQQQGSDQQVWPACAVLRELVLLHPDVARPAPPPAAVAGMSPFFPQQQHQQQHQPEWTKQSQAAFVAALDARLVDWLVGAIVRAREREPQVVFHLLRLVVEKGRALDFDSMQRVWSAGGLPSASATAWRLTWFQSLLPRLSTSDAALAHRVFTQLLCAMDVDQLSQGFDCFAAYYYECDEGVRTLWRLAVETKSASVARKASRMLLRLVLVRQEEDFFAQVMQHLAKCSEAKAEDDQQKRRCVQLAMAFLDSQLVLEPHQTASAASSSSATITLHHEGVFTFSNLDVGKGLEKRLKEPNSKRFDWSPGCVTHYDAETKKHTVCLTNEANKVYDFNDLSHEGALNAGERLYRMMSVADGRRAAPEFEPRFRLQASEALAKYRALEIKMDELMGGGTVSTVKDYALAELGWPGSVIQSVVQLVPHVPDRFEIQFDLGGNSSSSSTTDEEDEEDEPQLLPPCVERRGQHRVAVTDESLPLKSMLARFGPTWFLCMKLRPSAPISTTSHHHCLGADAVPVAESQHYALLLDLVGNSSETTTLDTRRDAWRLLMALPTEPELVSRTLPRLRHDEDAVFDWAGEVHARRGLLAKVYLLQVADQLSQVEEDEAPSSFAREFFTSAVSQAVFALFSGTVVERTEPSEEWERGIALQVLLRLMRQFVQRDGLLPTSHTLIAQLTTLVLSLCSSSSSLQVSLDALFVAQHLASAAETDDEELTRLILFGRSSSSGSSSLVDVLASSPFEAVQQSAHQLLASRGGGSGVVFSAALTTLETCPKASPTLFAFVMDLAKQQQQQHTDDDGTFAQLMGIVRRKLASDARYLELARFLLDQQQHQGDVELTSIVLRLVLTTLPSSMTRESRAQAFALLDQLAKTPANLHALASELDAFLARVSIPLARHGRAWDFHFQPEDAASQDDAFANKHVGLVNQGATCYQNSVLQQLFMRPKFRELILEATTSASATGDKTHLLHELQRTFAYLEHGQQKYYNPTGFVLASSALRLTDGHLSQNDCAEFFTLLIDYLEEVLAAPARAQLKRLLFSTMTSLTIRACPHQHRSERSESSLYIPLSIRFGAEGRALNSLDEALDEWSRAEHLTDLVCDDCKDKQPQQPQPATSAARFDGDQIKFISHFPPVLVLQLKRFDFDYETLQPFKLNHRVSFKPRLDLARFSRDAVLSQYDKAAETTTPTDAPHIWYRLRGVVVHQGTGASFGHYYSFIQQAEGEEEGEGQWCRFDDERVVPFDALRQLEEECFGGPVASSSSSTGSNNKPPATTMLRNNNGYLLIYEKEDEEVDDKHNRLSLAMAGRVVVQLRRWRLRAAAAAAARAPVEVVAVAPSPRDQLVQQVKHDNQRSMDHAVAFAPDFVRFCRTLPAAAAAADQLGLVVALRAFTRLALFAESEKDALDNHHWLNHIQHALQKQPDDGASDEACTALLQSFFTRSTAGGDDEAASWLERFLVHGAEPRSSRAFTELVVLLLPRADFDACVVPLSRALLALFPRSVSDVFRLVEGNYFTLLQALCRTGTGDKMRQQLLSHDLALHLVRLVDDAHAVRDARFTTKIVLALDALLMGEKEDGDEDEAAGFPLVSEATSRALFADTLCAFLVQHTPAAGKRLVPKLVDCSLAKTERSLDSLLQLLSSSQWLAKMQEAGTVVPDACLALEHLLLSIGAGEVMRLVRERTLNDLVKLGKQAKLVATERQPASSSLSFSSASTCAGERREAHRAAVILLFHVMELFNQLAKQSDTYRQMLRNAALKLPTLVTGLDVSAFDAGVKGNEPCGLREPHYGRIVRSSAQLSIALGHLPRPLLQPSYTLQFVVDGAGTEFVNGTYLFDGFFSAKQAGFADPSTPKFAQLVDDQRRRLVMYRCLQSDNQQQTWYISELCNVPGSRRDIDYYQTADLNGLPDCQRWTPCGVGLKPAPRTVVQSRVTPAPDAVLVVPTATASSS